MDAGVSGLLPGCSMRGSSWPKTPVSEQPRPLDLQAHRGHGGSPPPVSPPGPSPVHTGSQQRPRPHKGPWCPPQHQPHPLCTATGARQTPVHPCGPPPTTPTHLEGWPRSPVHVGRVRPFHSQGRVLDLPPGHQRGLTHTCTGTAHSHLSQGPPTQAAVPSFPGRCPTVSACARVPVAGPGEGPPEEPGWAGGPSGYHRAGEPQRTPTEIWSLPGETPTPSLIKPRCLPRPGDQHMPRRPPRTS